MLTNSTPTENDPSVPMTTARFRVVHVAARTPRLSQIEAAPNVVTEVVVSGEPVDAEVLPSASLSDNERFRYTELRGVVIGAAGGADAALEALAEIRDDRLYRESYSTFEAFMQGEYGKGARHGQHLRNLYRVRTIVRVELPDLDPTAITETGARELTSVPDANVAQVITEAHSTPDQRLTAKTLREARRTVSPTDHDMKWIEGADERERKKNEKEAKQREIERIDDLAKRALEAGRDDIEQRSIPFRDIVERLGADLTALEQAVTDEGSLLSAIEVRALIADTASMATAVERVLAALDAIAQVEGVADPTGSIATADQATEVAATMFSRADSVAFEEPPVEPVPNGEGVGDKSTSSEDGEIPDELRNSLWGPATTAVSTEQCFLHPDAAMNTANGKCVACSLISASHTDADAAPKSGPVTAEVGQ